MLASIGLDPTGLLGCQTEERLQGGAGAAACAELEHLAEQDQADDDRRRFEVETDLAVMVAER
jgi:hypothetical protein